MVEVGGGVSQLIQGAVGTTIVVVVVGSVVVAVGNGCCPPMTLSQ